MRMKVYTFYTYSYHYDLFANDVFCIKKCIYISGVQYATRAIQTLAEFRAFCSAINSPKYLKSIIVLSLTTHPARCCSLPQQWRFNANDYVTNTVTMAPLLSRTSVHPLTKWLLDDAVLRRVSPADINWLIKTTILPLFDKKYHMRS